jgi:WD40 repeat protein
VFSLAIRQDGTLLASGGGDPGIKLWSLPDGALLKTLTGPSISLAPKVVISPDGALLVSLPDGLLLKTLTGHSDFVRAVAISPDGTLLVTGCADKMIRLWSLPDGILLSSLVDPNLGKTTSAVCSPSDGATVGCTCDTVCTCNIVCTCDTVCTCDYQGSDWSFF